MNPTFQKSLQTQIEVLEREITPRRLKSISYLCSDEESLKKLQEFAFGDDWNSTRKKNETGASESEFFHRSDENQ
ncbi:hypothetical protein MAR_037690 [Mya arenaria]|uniref:Uncharacterized protein n=1 Tax=Mya arenaria TaxID=6604 RepID=A0ABY7FTG9_MYAAR|nr:hypothetical protein MAR_037690 [Mya arenaria]